MNKFILKYFILLIVLWFSMFCCIYATITHYGGVKQITIELGKELKDIKKQIEKD